MANIGSFSVRAGDSLIQFGVAAKTAVRARVEFAARFDSRPTVVLSPFWEGQRSEVGHAETIESASEDHFVAISNNAAANYFVSWVAVGPRAGAVAPPFPPRAESGDLLLFHGRQRRDVVTANTVGLGLELPAPPNIQLSPMWEGQGSGVGSAETIEFSNPAEFGVTTSGNVAANYYFTWLATGTRPGTAARSEFLVDDVLIRVGRGRKQTALTRISLGVGGEFAGPPTLIVTPFWEGHTGAVGHAETIHSVERSSFQVASGNAADNYYVSYFAIGPRR